MFKNEDFNQVFESLTHGIESNDNNTPQNNNMFVLL